jgi:hypothetical protein
MIGSTTATSSGKTKERCRWRRQGIRHVMSTGDDNWRRQIIYTVSSIGRKTTAIHENIRFIHFLLFIYYLMIHQNILLLVDLRQWSVGGSTRASWWCTSRHFYLSIINQSINQSISIINLYLLSIYLSIYLSIHSQKFEDLLLTEKNILLQSLSHIIIGRVDDKNDQIL